MIYKVGKDGDYSESVEAGGPREAAEKWFRSVLADGVHQQHRAVVQLSADHPPVIGEHEDEEGRFCVYVCSVRRIEAATEMV